MRIYAIAKELKIDSKDLVDICTKAGITGKGSALASLTEDEVVRLKSFLSGPKKEKEKEKDIKETGLKDKETKEDVKDIGIKSREIADKAPPEVKIGPAPIRPTRPEEDKGPITREDYIGPASGAKIRVIGVKPRPLSTDKPDDESKKPPKRRAPVISVTPLPDVKQPQPMAKAEEPRAQKPEIRLPKDGFTGRRPLEHLTKPAQKPTRPGKPPAHDAIRPLAGEPLPATPGRSQRGKKGKEVVPETAERGLAGMASSRADRQKARKSRVKAKVTPALGEEEVTPARPRRSRTLTRRGSTNTAAPRKGKVALELPCTVRSFSEAASVAVGQVQGALMRLGAMLTINEQIDPNLVELLCSELGVELEFKQQESLEDAVLLKLDEQEDDPESLEPRPPVVTFLGHVDHGKTSLLDYLIGTNVVSGEAGGITQHIRAYQIKKDGRSISFVDTPGHEAFTEMRARGANVTDIAVLVVAADDGIMPQTEEAISHAKAAGVPIVVALNKIDLPGTDINRIMTQMTEHHLVPSEWGGDIEVVKTSAITGQGMDQLLETLLGLADLHEYQANPHRPAMGTCLESQQEPGRGVVAKLMVKNGTLNVGDVIVCGSSHGRVKAMYDTLQTHTRVKTAGPSTPVNVTGLDIAPEAGDSFYALSDISQAREIAEARSHRTRARSLAGVTTKVSFVDFQQRLSEGRLGETPQVVNLNLIIRADVRGSIEAIEKELVKLEHAEVQIKVLHKAVGGITVGDVQLAHASQAVIVGFNVIPDENARSLADERGVEIRRYDIIYKVTDDIRAMLEGKLKPEERIVELGRAVVKQAFSISRVGTIAGCYVAQGTIERGCRIRVNRDGRTIGDYPLESLRRVKDDVKEVTRGMECGIKLAGFNDIKQDDLLEAYKIEEVARTL